MAYEGRVGLEPKRQGQRLREAGLRAGRRIEGLTQVTDRGKTALTTVLEESSEGSGPGPSDASPVA